MALLGGGGLITIVIGMFNFISGRIDKYRENRKEKRIGEISQTAELQRLKLDANDDIYERFGVLLTEREAEIKTLKDELEKCKNSATSPKLIAEMYRTCRIVIGEIEAMNLLFMDEEKTQIFARRFNNMQKAVKEMEEKLP